MEKRWIDIPRVLEKKEASTNSLPVKYYVHVAGLIRSFRGEVIFAGRVSCISKSVWFSAVKFRLQPEIVFVNPAKAGTTNS